jgi:hypothetical protein
MYDIISIPQQPTYQQHTPRPHPRVKSRGIPSNVPLGFVKKTPFIPLGFVKKPSFIPLGFC